MKVLIYKEEIINRLKKNSLKVTPKREALIEVLLKEDQFITAKDLYLKLKKQFSNINLTTVYRNIETFEKYGIIFKTVINNKETAYALCKSRNDIHHHHIICDICGKFSTIYCCNFEQIVKELSHSTGFTSIKHKIEFEGICPDCNQEQNKIKNLQIFTSPVK